MKKFIANRTGFIVFALVFTMLCSSGLAVLADEEPIIPISGNVSEDVYSQPSVWAEEEVAAALEVGIVPDSIVEAGWQNPTSRSSAAEAIVLLIELTLGMTMEEIADNKNWDLTDNQFDDCDDPVVTFLKYAGITQGIGGNKYAPDANYTRAQMVTMIGRAAEVFMGVEAQGESQFTDVPDWAAPYVAYAADITQGVGGGLFDSEGLLQNQHTAVFILRTFESWGLLDDNGLDELDDADKSDEEDEED